MSWLGVKYSLACRDARVKGSARLVLVALGVRVEYHRVTTSPTSLGDLKWLTFLSAEQIRRLLNDLEGWQKVRRLSRGKNAVYGLPEMAGPLFAIDDGDPVKMTDFVLEKLPSDLARDARRVPGRMTGFRRRMTDFAGRRAEGPLFPEVQSTSVRRSTDHDDAPTDDVQRFLIWWRASYRECIGTPYRFDRARDLGIVAELLDTYGFEPLQDLSRALWSVTSDQDRWIAGGDRSLKILRKECGKLAVRLPKVGVALPVDGCPHVPRCASVLICENRTAHPERYAEASA